MKVRLAFSILASVQPKIIVMDEWLSVGDQKFKDKASSKLNQMISSPHVYYWPHMIMIN